LLHGIVDPELLLEPVEPALPPSPLSPEPEVSSPPQPAAAALLTMKVAPIARQPAPEKSI
jgi:hypothetical protein